MCRNQNELENEMRKFNNFLNKTILGASKTYYTKELEKRRKELNILDDKDFENEYEKYIINNEDILENQIAQTSIDFINLCENIDLLMALKSLSALEQSVIFLLYNKDLSQQKISKILNLDYRSISRIKLRAFDKLKKHLKDGDWNEWKIRENI